MPLNIAVYASKKDPTPSHCGEITWEQLARDLQIHERTACTVASCLGHQCAHKDGLAWSPVRLRAPRRANENVESLSAAVFDLDDVTEAELADIGAKLEGTAYVLHSTHSGKGFRLVLKLSRDVLPEEWPALWRGAAKRFGLRADDACKDLARLYFFPSAPQGAEVVACEGFGASVDVDAILRASAVRSFAGPEGVSSFPPSAVGSSLPAGGPLDMSAVTLAVRKLKKKESRQLGELIISGKALSAPGNQSNTINEAVSVLVFLLTPALSLEHVTELLRPGVEAMEMLNGDTREWCYEQIARNYAAATERRAKSEAHQAAEKAAFARLAGRAPASDPEDAPASRVEVPATSSDDSWRSRLLVTNTMGGEKFKACEYNAREILLNDPEWRGTIRFNALTKNIDIKGGPLHGYNPNALDTELACWFQRSEYALTMGAPTLRPVLHAVSYRNVYDPLRDHLLSLPWDGKPRAESFLVRLLGASPSPYVALIGRKWLTSIVARGLEPGCKMDNMLILTGAYGGGKSTFVEIMAGEFYTAGSVDMRHKDGAAMMARYWLIEQAELSRYRETDRETIKNFLSQATDSYRPPYGRVVEDFPRRACLVGSANDEEILPEANRREWPVRVGADIDIRGLRAERNQLLAEAVSIYLAARDCEVCPTHPRLRCPAHSWWLEGDDMREVMRIASEFSAPDPLVEHLAAWWARQPRAKRPGEIILMDALLEALGVTRERITKQILRDAGHAMRRLGFLRHRVTSGGQQRWVYSPTLALLAAGEDTRPVPKDSTAETRGNVVPLRS